MVNYSYIKGNEELDVYIPDYNIFMMASHINDEAFCELPKGFYIRLLKESELDLWKAFPFDTKEEQIKYFDYMTNYFNNVYASQQSLFFEKCKVVCNEKDEPVATAFVWNAYGKFASVHWVKVKKEYEGLGLGRALLTSILKNVNTFPVYLHTQPSSYRAIKLYTDFGFEILVDDVIGRRKNEYKEAFPYLKQCMPLEFYQQLRFTQSDGQLSKEAAKYDYDGF